MSAEFCPKHGVPLGTGDCTCSVPMMLSDDKEDGSPGGKGKRSFGDLKDDPPDDAVRPSAPKELRVDRGSSVAVFSRFTRTRTGFWNVQNLTGDLIRQGVAMVSESIDSERNRVRLAFIASVIHHLGMDSVVLIEMGSDAEGFLRRLVDELNALATSEEESWASDISTDNGAIITPPEAFEADVRQWGDLEQRLWALVLLCDYYEVTRYTPNAMPSPRARLEAHLRVARQGGFSLPFTTILTYGGDEDDDFELTHEHVTASIERDAPKGRATAALERLLHGEPDLSCLNEVDEKLRALVFAVAAVTTGARVDFRRKKEIPSELDGPFRALRVLGVLSGRYEKYGILRRGRASAPSLLHHLVDTPLRQDGRRTNSRAAWSVNIPFQGHCVPAFFIHSMWTPADVEEDEELDDKNWEELRLETLVAQAQAAQKFFLQPVLIAGDTNVGAKHVDALNRRMRELGYRRVDNAPRTTLRTERTILRPSTESEEAMLSEPYDAVYFQEWMNETFDIAAAPPARTAPALQGSFMHLMVNNDYVRGWYRGLLDGALHPVLQRLEGRREHPGTQLVRKALPKRPETLAEFRQAMDALKQEDLPNEGELMRWVNAFLSLSLDSPRVFWAFHRHFVSDHRLMVIDLAKEDCLDTGEGRHSCVPSLTGTLAPREPWLGSGAQPATDGQDGRLTPGAGARVACLSQSRNTCGVRAAYNCLVFEGRQASHDDMWALAAQSLAPPDRPFVVDDAVDLHDDRVEHFLASNEGAHIPVITQFVYLDAMLSRLLPARQGIGRLEAFQREVRQWRERPPPRDAPPVLRLVLHTSAASIANRPSGAGHYIAVRLEAQENGYDFRYADSLSFAPDRSALIQSFIQRYLP